MTKYSVSFRKQAVKKIMGADKKSVSEIANSLDIKRALL